jgi:acyl-coenzyme A synthetase/AMP-(fatty) acid ligase
MMMPASLAALIGEERLTVWYSVPTALIQLLLRGNLEDHALDSLRWILFAGETFPEKHLQALRAHLPGARFSHVYGSTEVNVCTVYHLPDDGTVPSPLPIGRPCSNARALVLGDDGEPAPAGAPGELLIHGATMMTGYWDDPGRNAEALLRRPAPGGFQEPWYRTGDQVRSLDDGNLVFAGRADRQVKVRGFRVELEEVERALLDLEAVFEAAVWVVPDGEGSSALRAAVVADPAAKASPRRLAGALKQALPAYAVPGRIDLVDAMPRTPTGKVDRRALAALVAADDTATAGAD